MAMFFILDFEFSFFHFLETLFQYFIEFIIYLDFDLFEGMVRGGDTVRVRKKNRTISSQFPHIFSFWLFFWKLSKFFDNYRKFWFSDVTDLYSLPPIKRRMELMTFSKLSFLSCIS